MAGMVDVAKDANQVPGFPQDAYMEGPMMAMDKMVEKPETFGLPPGWSGYSGGMMTLVRVLPPDQYEQYLALKRSNLQMTCRTCPAWEAIVAKSNSLLQQLSTVALLLAALSHQANAQHDMHNCPECKCLAIIRMPKKKRRIFSPGPLLKLDDLEQMALSRNPTLSEANADIRSAEGLKKQVGLYPNPTVGYYGDEMRGGSYQSGKQGAFVSQTIVLGGKLGAARQTAEQQRLADRN